MGHEHIIWAEVCPKFFLPLIMPGVRPEWSPLSKFLNDVDCSRNLRTLYRFGCLKMPLSYPNSVLLSGLSFNLVQIDFYHNFGEVANTYEHTDEKV
jgi:hypothetical protein